LFPLLSILFEKCELATKSVESSSTYDFTEDIKYFVEHKLKDKTEIACEDNEVNELVRKYEFHLILMQTAIKKKARRGKQNKTFVFSDDWRPTSVTYTST